MPDLEQQQDTGSVEQAPLQVTPELQEARQQAGRFGWTDLESWEAAGKDPKAWVDADVFLSRGKEYNGYLRKQNDNLQHQLDELRDTLTAFQEHHNKVAQHAYEKALSDLKASRKQALKEGNLELVAELEDHIEQAQAEAPKPVAPAKAETKITPDAEREFQTWVGENPWFNTRAGRAVAESIGREWQGKLSGRAFLDKVAEEVRAEMPHLFENPNRRAPAAVDTGGTRPSPRGGKSGADLPDDAKKAGAKFVKQGLFKSLDEYAKEYFELEGE